MAWDKWGWAALGAATGGLVVYVIKVKKYNFSRLPFRSFYGAPKGEIKSLLEKPSANVTLLSADFCPFAARAWLALLEKGIPFEHIQCSYFMGEKDPGTKVLYGLGLRTVPAMIHNGQIFTESTELANYIDDAFSGTPLKPADASMRFNMNLFLTRHNSLPGCFYTFLKNQDQEKHAELAAKTEGVLKTVNDDLSIFDGPFLCGDQLTLADIQLFGFIERLMVVAPAWKKGWCIPIEFTNIPKWFSAMKARDSAKIASADRSELSLKAHCFEAKTRDEYLIEVYQCYAENEVDLAKEKQRESGKVGFNAYKKFKGVQLPS